MKPGQRFPKELLNESTEARVNYFEKLTIEHTCLNQAYEKAMAAVSGQTGPKVILVAGPTGAGKTTLAARLYRSVIEKYQEQIDAEKDLVPILYGNAIAPNGVSFNWKDFYVRLLERAMEPLIDRKTLVPRQLSFLPNIRGTSVHERTVSDALRRSVEECLRRRRTKVLIIDEAHHILMVNNPKRLEFQFEALKSLAIETQATIVLVGTYKLLDIRDQSGQLVRRSEIIHFPRYDIRKPQDKCKFTEVLNTFADQLPIAERPDLAHWGLLFYEKTGGCVGILKDWLTRALERHLQTKNKVFDWAFLEQYAMTNKALQTIIEEALAGEEKLLDIPIKDLEYLLRNGLPNVANGIPKKTRATAVGKRSPVRDPVGAAYAQAA